MELLWPAQRAPSQRGTPSDAYRAGQAGGREAKGRACCGGRCEDNCSFAKKTTLGPDTGPPPGTEPTPPGTEPTPPSGMHHCQRAPQAVKSRKFAEDTTQRASALQPGVETDWSDEDVDRHPTSPRVAVQAPAQGGAGGGGGESDRRYMVTYRPRLVPPFGPASFAAWENAGRLRSP